MKINMDKKNRKLVTLILVFMLIFSLVLSGCDNPVKNTARYAVTFNFNDGNSRPYTARVKEGTSVSAPADPVCTGLSFDGWWTESAGGSAAVLPAIPTADLTYYAHWKVAVHTVVFDPNYDDKPAFFSSEVVYGDIVVFPSGNPGRAGHTFEGWWTAKTGGVRVTAATIIKADATYYAHWSINRYTITYDYNYTGAPQSGYATYDYNNDAPAPAEPQRTGHTFDGWWTEGTGGNQIAFPYTVKESVTMYAHWKTNSYTIKFEYNYGVGDADKPAEPAAVTRTVNYGSLVVAPSDTIRDRHTFNGWYSAATGGVSVNFSVPVTGNATYYAQWRENAVPTYAVTFNENYGSTPATQKVDVEQGKSTAGLQEPFRTGYKFNGWWTASTGGSMITFPYTPTDDITIYAHWEILSYAVTFNYNYNDAPSAHIEQIPYGGNVSEPQTPVRPGYGFTGWYTASGGGSLVVFPLEVLTNLTFYAQWKVSVFTITYDANGAGDAVTNLPLPANSANGFIQRAPNNPRRVGWQFTGWWTERAGGIQIDFPYTTTESAVTVYARWTRIKYALFFDPNFPDSDPAVEGETIEYGSLLTADMLPGAPVRSGFRFSGWYTAARSDDGDLIAFPYNPSNPNDTMSLEKQLYAHWTAQQLVTDTFHAEYVLFNVKDEYKGLSGSVNGLEAITMDAEGAGAAVDLNLPREALGISETAGYFVAYLSTENARLNFEIYSARAISNVTLRVALMSDLNLSSGASYTFGPTGINAYSFVVNGGTPLSYGNITLQTGAPFTEYQISTTVNLAAGKNVISLITANSNPIQGGTTTGIGPRVDYIRLTYGGEQGALSYYPIYDNVRS